jgi:hypothetical protein
VSETHFLNLFDTAQPLGWRRPKLRGSAMRRLFLGLLILAAMTGGYPYASLLINYSLGTNTVVFAYGDGTERALVSGPDAPRPDWLPIMPGATIVTAGRWVASPVQADAGDVELAVRADLDEVKQFYMESLSAGGFEVRDLGTYTLAPPIAAHLGIANMLYGYNSASETEINVDIRTPSGWILPSRPVQVRWRKTSAPLQLESPYADRR